ncbi:carbohydrate ABC transporter membrane protein 1, CUT1 family [Micromonospora rhizosphaerae]|uniref:Carbohydrate ABC transporter membrane protein 1, CUT1 family n=1 Tax=Micromonospora rhizosphaerae TaxID=568872 RepID=A0A1C6SB43_9ACTN|nr:sugar ABC transporter permease [Micromonospora rhizosphaerae]SCL26614.1 carbohydrate ABC transporter membrane protein 1, CUT1 family [Micromonospora rhizosphaerae]
MTMTVVPAPAETGHSVAPPGRNRRVRQHWGATPYLFLLPALTLLGVFFVWPAVTAVQLAFYDYRVVSPAEFVGLGNFSHMLGDDRFYTALTNSGLFLIGMLPILVVIPLLLAVLVNLPLRGIKVFRLVYYLPVVTSMVAVAIAWNYVYHQRGILNWLLNTLGLLDQPVQYLLDPGWALPALVLVESWKSLGYYMMIYLAGLQSVPRELYEAAAVDGAGPWRRLSSITVPMLRPYIAVVMVLAALDSMQVFTSVFVMTQGGPQDGTLTLGYYIYDAAFRHFNMGYASAMGLVLWAILVVFSLVSYRLTRGKAAAR